MASTLDEIDELIELTNEFLASNYPEAVAAGDAAECLEITVESGMILKIPFSIYRGPDQNRRRILCREEDVTSPQQSPRTQRKQFVYFIQETITKSIKIGVSAKPKDRLHALSTSHPKDLVLLGIIDGGKAEESLLHQRFEAHRIRGEWFSVEILPAVTELIRIRSV